MHPVDALKDCPTREEIGYGESANGVDTKLRRNPLRLLRVAVGPILVLAAIVCAALNLTLPLPTLADHNPGAVPAGTETHMALLVATILLAVIGLALSIRTFARWCGKAGSQLNIGARLALRGCSRASSTVRSGGMRGADYHVHRLVHTGNHRLHGGGPSKFHDDDDVWTVGDGHWGRRACQQ